jgi:hypothetical protein
METSTGIPGKGRLAPTAVTDGMLIFVLNFNGSWRRRPGPSRSKLLGGRRLMRLLGYSTLTHGITSINFSN